MIVNGTNSILEHGMPNAMPLHISVAYTMIWVIKNYYAKYSLIHTTIGQYAANLSSRNHQNDYINMIFNRARHATGAKRMAIVREGFWGKGDLSKMTLKEYQPMENTTRTMAVWFVDNLSSFSYLKRQLLSPANNWDRRGAFTMIYMGKGDWLKDMQIMFEQLFQIYVLNINVIVPGETTQIYTYFPFQVNSCNSAEPQLILEIDKNSHVRHVKYADERYFIDKVSNLYGCIIYLTAWTEMPFVDLEYNHTTGEVIKLRGVEGYLMALLADMMNFSIYIRNPPDLARGVIYENGTLTGALKMIYEGESNISMNSYVNELARSRIMESAYSYMSCRLGVVVPNGSPLKSWERLVKPFKFLTWFTLLISIVVALIVIFAIKMRKKSPLAAFVFGHKNRIPLSTLLAVMYGNIVTEYLPKRNFARFLFAAWLWYTFILRSAYISELYYILNDVRGEKHFHTLADVVRENLTFMVSPLQKDMISTTLHTNNIQTVTSLDFPQLFKAIQAPDARFAIVALEPTIRRFNRLEELVGGTVNMVPETIATYEIVLFMRKNSFLKQRIDTILQRLMSTGIVSNFIKLYKHQFAAQFKDQRAPLSMYVLADLFKIYGALLFCCFMVFLLELWSQRSTTARRVITYFNI